MKRRLAVAAGVATGALLLSGCAAGPSEGDNGNQDREYAIDADLTTLIDYDAGTWHPLLSAGAGYQVSEYTSDRLFWTESTGELKPWIATEWSEGPDSITMTIRDDVTCSDGSAFTAETVAKNLEFVINPDNASPWYDSMVPANSTVAVDGNTVTLTTAEPRSFIAFNLASLPLVCDAALEDPDAYQTKSASTGIFVMTGYAPGDSLTLERRDDYAWAPDDTTGQTPGVPKTVTIKIVSDVSTATNMLLSGDLNAGSVGGPDMARLLAAGLEYDENHDAPQTIYFNHVAGIPTADLAVRTALTQALDLDAVNQVMLEGEGARATSTMETTPKACVYDSVTGNLPATDPDAAVNTLEDDGWMPGPDGIRQKDGMPLHIDLFYNNSTDSMSAAAEIVAGEWEKLGADVTLTGGDSTWLVGATWSAEDLTSWGATLGLTMGFNSPAAAVPLFSGAAPPNGINFSSIANDAYSQKVAEAYNAVGEASCPVWEEAEAALITNVDFAPIASGPVRMFFNGAEQTVDSVEMQGFALRALK